MTDGLSHIAGLPAPRTDRADLVLDAALVTELTDLLHDVSCALALKGNDAAEMALLDRADALLKQVAAYQGKSGKPR
jgi:hypothetical protein